MYFVIRTWTPQNENGEALLEIHNHFRVGNVWDWTNGRALKPNERDVPVPIRIDFDPLRGYREPPPEFWDDGIPLMAKRVRGILEAEGIDNIDYFQAILRNTETGEEFDYFAFKLIGLVSATDFSKSEWQSYDGRLVADVSFDGLALDPNKTQGHLMFRLAEDVSALIVHEKIKKALEEAGVTGPEYFKPEEWVQI